MLVDVLMPDLDLRRSRPRVSLWLVDVGAAVLCGDGILEISADGVTIDLPAPADGVLHAIFVGEDDELTPGQRLGQIAAAVESAT